jgi:ubiquinone/menaquinone biosynthesis C-methylase UbiE
MSQTQLSATFLAAPDIHQEWESDYLNRDLDRFYDSAFARLIAGLGASPGDRILDAGCGYCFHAGRLARSGLRVTGVDFSPSALAEARRNLARQGLSIELVQGNLLALPFPAESFPYVNCWGVLMHIPELEKALEELARVLQPGGRLSITENNRRSLHVMVWERALRGVKRLLGRKLPRRDAKPQGIEEWRDEGLMIRKLDIDWLVDFYAKRGLKLVDRFAGQFTELYTSVPGRPLKRLVYRFNEYWFNRRGSPALAVGNCLIFEKTGQGR